MTIRAAWEGGKFGGTEADRLRMLKEAVTAGAEYVDLEYVAWRDHRDACKHFMEAVHRTNGATKLILSQHDFKRTPGNLDAIFAEMEASDADIIKLATTARQITDSLRMLQSLKYALRPTIGLCMGGAGRDHADPGGQGRGVPDVLQPGGGRGGGAGAGAGGGHAGDVPVPADHRPDDGAGGGGRSGGPFDEPGTAQRGVRGAGHRRGIRAVRGGRTGSFGRFIDGVLEASWLNVRGLSVTIPHKLAAIERADEVEPLAKKIGAANTLAIGEDFRIRAYNTDYAGAIRALCEGAGLQEEDLAGKTAAVLGAGGVARAVVAGLVDAGCEVTICNRTLEKAEELAEEFGGKALEWENRGRLRTQILVNCTSIGMWPNPYEEPMAKEALQEGQIVFDTVYNPPQTRLLLHGTRRGCMLVDGVAMFVHQGALQMQHWFGRSGALDRMRQVVMDRLRRHH